MQSGEAYQTELRVGVFSTHRPIILNRGGVGVETLDRWRDNAVIDGAVTVRRLDGGLELTSGFASSQTAIYRRLSEDPGNWIFEPSAMAQQNRQSSAFFQHLKADVIKTDAIDADLELSYVSAGQSFRSAQTSSIVDLSYEGSTFNGVAQATFGETTASFEKEVHGDHYFDYDRNIVRMARGAIGAKITLETDEIRFDSDVFSSNRMVSGRFGLDLGKVWGERPAWTPDEVTLGFSWRASRQATLIDSPDAVRRSFGLGFGKSGDHYVSDVYVYWNQRNDFQDTAFAELDTEFGADVFHSVFYDDWDLSVYVNMSELKRDARYSRVTSERLLTGGMAFTKRFDALPDIKLSVDAFSLDADEFRDNYFLQTHDVSARFEADISEAVLSRRWRAASARRSLSLWFAAYAGWSVIDDNFAAAAEADQETRLLLMLRAN